MKRNHIVSRPVSERSRSSLKPRFERLERQRAVREAEEQFSELDFDFGSDLQPMF